MSVSLTHLCSSISLRSNYQTHAKFKSLLLLKTCFEKKNCPYMYIERKKIKHKKSIKKVA